MKYRILEDEATADLAIEAYGNNLREAFENSARAICESISDTSKIDEQEIKLVNKKAKTIEMLLYEFLEEILYFHDADNLVFKKVIVKELDEKIPSISAIFYGENFDKKKHSAKSHIKAITYHKMVILKEKGKATIRFIVDV